jgi:hypothetical protein
MNTKTRTSRKKQSTSNANTLDTTATTSEAIDFTTLGDPDSDSE